MKRLLPLLVVCLSSVYCGSDSGPTSTTPTPTATTVPQNDGSSSPTTGPWWVPAVQTSWQWQLDDETVDTSVNAQMYDIDVFDHDAGTVAALQAQGLRVVCYVSVGTVEDWRPDANQFPSEVIGDPYAGWPGERWLDIRRIDLLAPVLRARLDMCRNKGFDGVEPDNIDGHTYPSGFPLTPADQLAFNQWVAEEAHQRGLSIGLKNDPEQAAELVNHFDWAMTEDCFFEGWCDQLDVFVAANKAVFAAEYTDQWGNSTPFCSDANAMNFNAILKNRELDAHRVACR